jgi:hypothetical protein
MKSNYKLFLKSFSLVIASLFVAQGCEREISEGGDISLPTDPNVFIDGFSGGLDYGAFGSSVPTAFQVDNEVTYNGSTASMRFEVPDVNDPRGAYAGGSYITSSPRNLSGYDALTFWAKASTSATIDIVGFGNDFGANTNQVSVAALKVNTNWKKYFIPIPDPSKFKSERGMFFYSEGPEDSKGYTFWIDELKFEKLGTLSKPNPKILDGLEKVVQAENGDKFTIDGLGVEYNLPNGINQLVNVKSNFFKFASSNPSVANVDNQGVVTVNSAGTADITAWFADSTVLAIGSLKLTSIGDAIKPKTIAPVPTRKASDVISMYSNVYPNVNIDTWNTRWQFSTAEEEFVKILGDDVIKYKSLNFVGIEFTSNKINARDMTHFHIDLWTPEAITAGKRFLVKLIDFGANGTFGGGDDKEHELAFTSPTLKSQEWVSLDIPLSNFAGLTTRANLAQMVFSGDLPNIFVDNIYFYKDVVVAPTVPTTPAPGPTVPSASVTSIFSDAYPNVSGSNLNPNWGQATVVSQIPIQGNNTLRYAGLNYQGLEIGSNINVSTSTVLHVDYWTSNSSSLKLFLISSGPTVEVPITLTTPTTGWRSIDIPLSSFSPVDLTKVFQLKFEGNGDIYLDNIYFRR